MAGIQIDGVNNKIDFDDDADTSISSATDDTLVVEVGGNTLATVTATSVTFNDGVEITTADNTDTLTLKSTDDDTAEGPVLKLARDPSGVAAGDNLGAIKFVGDDDAGNATEYFEIQASAESVGNGTEDGRVTFALINNGTARNILDITSGNIVFNQDSQDLDFRVESNGDANAINVNAGNDRVHMFNSDGDKGKLCVEGGGTAGASAAYGIKRGSLSGTIGISSTGDVTIVSDDNEVRAQDSAGNSTIISPHNFEMIPDGASEELAWAYYSRRGDGEGDYDNTKYVNVDIAKVVRSLENLTGEKFIYTGIGNTDDGSTVTQNKLKQLEDRIAALEGN